MATNHYRQLDGLRFFASMCVVGLHYFPVEQYPSSILLNRVGMCLFMMLGGYLATLILLKNFDRADRSGYPRTCVLVRYYARRALRLCPLLFTAVGLMWVVGVPGIDETWSWHLTFRTNLYQILHVIAPDAPHLWYLGAQEQALLLLAVVMLFLPASKVPVLMGVGIVLSVISRVSAWQLSGGTYYIPMNLPFSHMDLFCTGGLLAYYRHTRPVVSDRMRRCWRVLLGISVTSFVFSRYHVLQTYPNTFEIIMMTTLACPLYAWLVNRISDGFSGVIKAMLSHRVPVFLGTIGYGIYVYHMVSYKFVPALCQKMGLPLNYVIDRLFGWTGWDPPDLVWGHWFSIMFWFAVSLVMAVVSYYLVELPVSSLKRFIPCVPAEVMGNTPATDVGVAVSKPSYNAGNRNEPPLAAAHDDHPANQRAQRQKAVVPTHKAE